VKPSSFQRFVIWPTLAASYLSLVGAIGHWATDSWSGAASLGVLFAVAIGSPVALGYAGYLWFRGQIGAARWEAAASVALPVLILVVFGSALVGDG